MQIWLLKDALQKAGLPLYLAPYGVLPTAYECGIIEVPASLLDLNPSVMWDECSTGLIQGLEILPGFIRRLPFSSPTVCTRCLSM